MINIGARSGSQIIPYSGATKRTKEVNLTIGTVTTSAGNVSSPLVRRAVAVFYADSNGVWRMRFNVRITFTAITCTTVTVPVTGVLFKSQSGSFYQSTSGFFDIAAPIQCFAFANTANLYATLASTNISAVGFSGDVELESEPTAYTTADYMEGVVDASIYIPPADASTTGLLTHEAQTIGGVKDFAAGIKLATGTTLSNYTESAEGDLGTITWTGTPPSGGIQYKKYRYNRVGNQVFVYFRLAYQTAGTTNTQAYFSLTGLGLPMPASFTGDGDGQFMAYRGVCDLSANQGAKGTTGAVSILRASVSAAVIYCDMTAGVNAVFLSGSIVYTV